MSFTHIFAQAAAPAGGPGMGAFLFQIAAIIGIFYFVLIRPQQKERKRHEEALKALKKGDRIVTAGGLVGEIGHMPSVLDDKVNMDDQITVKSGESKLIVERGRIARVVVPTP
jgi:preprotein translocase subunit YajC